MCRLLSAKKKDRLAAAFQWKPLIPVRRGTGVGAIREALLRQQASSQKATTLREGVSPLVRYLYR